jgi:S-formylglutathione hydrolase FrmB
VTFLILSPDAPRPAPNPAATDWTTLNHGVSLLGGWLPLTVELMALSVVVAVVGWRTKHWWLRWLPPSIAVGVTGALATRTYVNSEALASDPAPIQLWLWTGVFLTTLPVAVFGWRGARWWRRALSVLAIPLTLLAALLNVNRWVGYYPTVPAAWNALAAAPLPDEIDPDSLASLRNTTPEMGKLVKVDIPDTASGFTHRSEYVYLPPAWFAGSTPPILPAVMMIAGEFNTPADWIRSGNVIPVIDDYSRGHRGKTPIFVFVDSGGSFNNDTECVNGPRGQAADHLTGDVPPYVVAQFGASADPAAWGVVGWSMGGTCAVDLAVMHPDLFDTFVDIAGDHGPTAGTKQQTIERLYAGDAGQWNHYDPATVMAEHGPYHGVAGWFADAASVATRNSNQAGHPARPQSSAPLGYGGHDVWTDNDRTDASHDLCRAARAVHIDCTVHSTPSGHTWQFATQSFAEALPWLDAQLSTTHNRPPGA